MRSGFPGFPNEGMQFFRGLAHNNNRDWFLPRKALFEEHVKRPMVELVEALNRGLAGFAPDYVSEPGRAIYRFYRDTRFSNDKTPYKDHIAASFSRRGMPKNGYGGFYFSVSHKEIEVGGGIYLPEREVLLTLRRHIADHYQELRRITGTRTVKRLLGEVQGEQLARVPKGFPPDHPAANLLRMKYYVLFVTLPPDCATTPRLYTEILKRFEAMAPFIEYLGAPLVRAKEARTEPKGGHFGGRHLPVDF